jgi:hypothetical protein
MDYIHLLYSSVLSTKQQINLDMHSFSIYTTPEINIRICSLSFFTGVMVMVFNATYSPIIVVPVIAFCVLEKSNVCLLWCKQGGPSWLWLCGSWIYNILFHHWFLCVYMKFEKVNISNNSVWQYHGRLKLLHTSVCC